MKKIEKIEAHNNEEGEIHKGDPRECKECSYLFWIFDEVRSDPKKEEEHDTHS